MLRYFLGVEIMRRKHGIFLSQRKYVLDLLSKTRKLGVKSCYSPMAPSIHLTREGGLFGDPERYRRLVGKLNYFTVTRPDIAHSISVVSQYMSSLTVDNWEVVEHILCYLKGASGRGILYSNHGIIGLSASRMLIRQGQRKIRDPHLVTVFLLVEI